MKLLSSLRRIGNMVKKEFIQTLRDPRMRLLLVGPPLIQMLVFGYAATLDVRNVTLSVLDFDHTQESRELVARFSSSRYFHLQGYASRPGDLSAGLESGDILAGMQINSGFSQRLRNGHGASVQVLLDCSNSNTALVALGYINQIGAQFSHDFQLAQMRRSTPQLASAVPQIDLQVRPWFNAGLESQWYFVPGVIGNVLLILVMMLTAFAIVREREIGTLEQIMVTPIRRWEFILGKTIPFFLVGCFDATLIALVGTFWFRVPFRGNLSVLAVGLVVFILAGLGLGLFLSTVAANQQQAMIGSFFFTMPMITLSGFGTPVASMPPLLQKTALANPLLHVMILLRGVYLRGVGFDVLWPQIAAMTGIAAFLLTISILRFHKSLE